MTSISTAPNVPHSRPAVKMRRTTVYGLRTVAANLNRIAILFIAAATIFRIGPIGSNPGILAFTVTTLTIWGGAQLVEFLLDEATSLLDPDARDGDVAFDAATLLQELASDVRNGANIDDVLTGLHASKILPALSQTLGALADAFDADGHDEEASDLYAAAITTRDAAGLLGHKTA